MTQSRSGPPIEVGAGARHHSDNRPTTYDSSSHHSHSPNRASDSTGSAQVGGSAARCDSVAQLRNRRRASWRQPSLESGHSDPWRYEPPGTRGYAEAVQHLLGHNLLPAPNHAALQEMFRSGGTERANAQQVAAAWELDQ